jgi:Flp pilus assembly protein TadG
MNQKLRSGNSQQGRAARIDRRSRFSKGQMAVLFTLVLPVLLGVMALGSDFSVIYFNWAMVQKAADAAALAGASQLTGQSGSASTVQPAAVNYVNGYACLNGIADSSDTYPALCTPGPARDGYADRITFTNVTDTTVQVGIKRSVPYFFGKLIGLQEAAVAATATAAIQPTGGIPTGMFPVGIQCTPNGSGKCDVASLFNGQSVVNFGSKFVLNNNNNNMQASGGAPGNWDWIDVGQGQGASGLGAVLEGGASGSYSVSQTVNTSPGIGKGNSQPAQNGLNARLAACAPVTQGSGGTDPCSNGGDTSALKCNDPCLIAVPAIDFSNCNGNCSRQIEGFAQMYLEQGSTTSAISACYVSTNNCQTVGSAGAPNLGALSPPVLIN